MCDFGINQHQTTPMILPCPSSKTPSPLNFDKIRGFKGGGVLTNLADFGTSWNLRGVPTRDPFTNKMFLGNLFSAGIPVLAEMF